MKKQASECSTLSINDMKTEKDNKWTPTHAFICEISEIFTFSYATSTVACSDI